MSLTNRREYRVPASCDVVFYWEDSTGEFHTSHPRARDVSSNGMRVENAIPLDPGHQVVLQIPGHCSAIEAAVRYCVREGDGYRIGLEFSSPEHGLPQAIGTALDYY